MERGRAQLFVESGAARSEPARAEPARPTG